MDHTGTPREPGGAPAPLDRDLYCRTCGYNLRGLSGNPVRCPECGTDNTLSEIEIPADLIRRALQNFESYAAYFGFSVVLIGLIVVMLPHAYRNGRLGGCLILAAGATLSLPVSGYLFARSCGFQNGWKSVLAGYLVLAVCGAAMVCSPILGGRVWLDHASSAQWLVRARIIIAASVAGLIVAITIGLGAYRRVRIKMASLQRRTAVTIARRELAELDELKQMTSRWNSRKD